MVTRIAEDVETSQPCALLAGMRSSTTTMDNSMEVPPKIKGRAMYDPSISLSGIIPK